MKTIDQLYEECAKTLSRKEFIIMAECCEQIDIDCFGYVKNKEERFSLAATKLFHTKVTAVMEKALIGVKRKKEYDKKMRRYGGE
jgi:hypothetical protein